MLLCFNICVIVIMYFIFQTFQFDVWLIGVTLPFCCPRSSSWDSLSNYPVPFREVTAIIHTDCTFAENICIKPWNRIRL